MAESIYIEIEENKNCDYMPLLVYEAHSNPVPIDKVILDEPDRIRGVYSVTGWSSKDEGTPCAAMYAPVSDSGQAVVHLVYGGDWGIRLKLETTIEDWDILSGNQHGEPYLMFVDGSDIVLNSQPHP